MKICAVLMSSVVTVMASGNVLASDQSWYAAGQIGVRAVEDQSIDIGAGNIDLEQHNGLYASAAIGRAFRQNGIGFRAEIETAWRGAGRISRFSVNNIPTAVTGDGLTALSVMANGIVDFNNGSRFTPYLGAGIGLISLKGDIDAGLNRISDSATGIGVQAIGGLDTRITQSVSLFADLRYQKAFEPSLTLVGSAGSGEVTVDYDAFTVGAGIRLRF